MGSFSKSILFLAIFYLFILCCVVWIWCQTRKSFLPGFSFSFLFSFYSQFFLFCMLCVVCCVFACVRCIFVVMKVCRCMCCVCCVRCVLYMLRVGVCLCSVRFLFFHAFFLFHHYSTMPETIYSKCWHVKIQIRQCLEAYWTNPTYTLQLATLSTSIWSSTTRHLMWHSVIISPYFEEKLKCIYATKRKMFRISFPLLPTSYKVVLVMNSYASSLLYPRRR